MDDDGGIRALVLRAVLESDDPDTLDLVYRILISDKIEGTAE
jgi:hypothetical protein